MHRDVGDAEVVSELVLSCVLLKKAVDVGVARMKHGTIVARPLRSDFHHRIKRRSAAEDLPFCNSFRIAWPDMRVTTSVECTMTSAGSSCSA